MSANRTIRTYAMTAESAIPPTGESRRLPPAAARLFRITLRTAFICALGSPGAFTVAQEENGSKNPAAEATLQEVMVTAQKREERAQDVPIALSVVETGTLAANNQTQLQDFYAKVPGLGITALSEGRTQINIRGLTLGGQSPPTVGTLIDDVPFGFTRVPLNNANTADIDPGDLASMEVLRGPQGTLYGAASMGGLIKFVTVGATTDRVKGRLQAGFESVSTGDDFGYLMRGSINVPLGDTLAIRASGFLVDNAGFVDNVRSGEKDVNRRVSEGGRLAGLWQPSDAFSVNLNAMIQHNDTKGPSVLDTTFGVDDPAVDFLIGSGWSIRDLKAFSAVLNGRLGDTEVTSISGYTKDYLDILQDARFGNRFPATLPSISSTAKVSQELRASIPLGEKITWLVGGFYTKENFWTHWGYENVGLTTGVMEPGFCGPNSLPELFSATGRCMDLISRSTYDETAAFTDVTYQFTDRLDVQFGGRYGLHGATTKHDNTGALASRAPSLSKQSFDGHSFTYLVTPRLKVSPDLMMYGRVATGYRPGGPNTNCGFPGIPCAVSPDETLNYEIGAKGNAFNRALSFDASIYYIDWTDIQLQLTNVGQTLAYQANAGRASSRGVELSVAAQPLRGLNVSAWVAVNEAELAEDLPVITQRAGLKGDRLPYSSPLSGSFSVDQEFNIGAGQASVGGSASYVDDRESVFERPGVERMSFPSYVQLDVRAGMKYETWSVNLFITNVTDKRGILRIDSNERNKINIVRPRTLGVSMTKTFAQ